MFTVILHKFTCTYYTTYIPSYALAANILFVNFALDKLRSHVTRPYESWSHFISVYMPICILSSFAVREISIQRCSFNLNRNGRIGGIIYLERDFFISYIPLCLTFAVFSLFVGSFVVIFYKIMSYCYNFRCLNFQFYETCLPSE